MKSVRAFQSLVWAVPLASLPLVAVADHPSEEEASTSAQFSNDAGINIYAVQNAGHTGGPCCGSHSTNDTLVMQFSNNHWGGYNFISPMLSAQWNQGAEWGGQPNTQECYNYAWYEFWWFAATPYEIWACLSA